MPAPTPNLLWSLHRLAHAQDENFITEAFADLLRGLLAHDATVGCALIARLTGGALTADAADAARLEVSTQIRTDHGQPDMAVSLDDHLVYVEAKVEAPLSPGQLASYRAALAATGRARTTLVLLSRYRGAVDPSGATPDATLRWSDVAGFLRRRLAAGDLASDVGRHVADQMLEFLRRRGLSMERADAEMVPGLVAMLRFVEVLREAVHEAGESPKSNSRNDYRGFGLEGNRYWVGIRFDEPHLLSLCTDYIDTFQAEAWEQLPAGRVEAAPWLPHGQRWNRELDLTAADVGFFEKNVTEQQDLLAAFIRESMAMARGATAGLD